MEIIATWPLIEVKSCQTVSRVFAWCEASVDPKLSVYSLARPLNTRIEINVILTDFILSHFGFGWNGVEEEFRIGVSIVFQFCLYLSTFHFWEVISDAACIALISLCTIIIGPLVHGVVAHQSNHSE